MSEICTIVSILGTDYKVCLTSNEAKYPSLKDCNGYIDDTIKLLVVRNEFNKEESAMEDPSATILKNIRHEVIHAFLYESGLDFDSSKAAHWAVHEEMVDYFAIQFPKMEQIIDTLTNWYNRHY